MSRKTEAVQFMLVVPYLAFSLITVGSISEAAIGIFISLKRRAISNTPYQETSKVANFKDKCVCNLSTGTYGQWSQRSCFCATWLCAPGRLLQSGQRTAEETGDLHCTSSRRLGLCYWEGLLNVLNHEKIRKTTSLQSEKMFYLSRFGTGFVFLIGNDCIKAFCLCSLLASGKC